MNRMDHSPLFHASTFTLFSPLRILLYARVKVKKLQTLFTKQGRVNNVKSVKIDFVAIFS